MTLYAHASRNIAKTWLLMTIFLIVVIGIGWFFSRLYANPAILTYAVIFSVLMSGFSYWFSDKVVVALTGAKPAMREKFPEFYNALTELAAKANLPMPKLYVVNDDAPNAFATGRNPKHAAVAATTGLLEKLNRDELEGVMAHELSHIGNRDMLLSTVVVVLVGFVSILSNWFMRMTIFGRRDREGRGSSALMLIGFLMAILAPIVAMLIQLAISRKREFLADASGALLTKNPGGLASALKKIASHPGTVRRAHMATAHLYIENPFKADVGGGSAPWIVKIFLTHPPVEERIKTLRGM